MSINKNQLKSIFSGKIVRYGGILIVIAALTVMYMQNNKKPSANCQTNCNKSDCNTQDCKKNQLKNLNEMQRKQCVPENTNPGKRRGCKCREGRGPQT